MSAWKSALIVIGMCLSAAVAVAEEEDLGLEPLEPTVHELPKKVSTNGDLHFENEAEEMEIMDEKALREETKREAKALDRENQRLRQKVGQLQRESDRIKKTNDRTQDRYKQAVVTSNKLKSEVNQAQNQRDRLQKNLENLQFKVEQVETHVVEAKNARNQARQDALRMERSIRSLEARKKRAQALVDRYSRELKDQRGRNRKFSAREKQLERDVSALEQKAERLESRRGGRGYARTTARDEQTFD